MCMCMCLGPEGTQMSSAPGGQKEATGFPRSWSYIAICECPDCAVLGTELRSSGRAVGTINNWSISADTVCRSFSLLINSRHTGYSPSLLQETQLQLSVLLLLSSPCPMRGKPRLKNTFSVSHSLTSLAFWNYINQENSLVKKITTHTHTHTHTLLK